MLEDGFEWLVVDCVRCLKLQMGAARHFSNKNRPSLTDAGETGAQYKVRKNTTKGKTQS